jgi:hypothetical protein
LELESVVTEVSILANHDTMPAVLVLEIAGTMSGAEHSNYGQENLAGEGGQRSEREARVCF